MGYFKLFFTYIFLCLIILGRLHGQYNKRNNTDDQTEIISLFWNQAIKPYSYLDTVISNDVNIKLLKARYDHQKRFYKNSDSICRSSNDTLKLKIFCPIADSFSFFNELLTPKDFEYFNSTQTKKTSIDYSKIRDKIMVAPHSKDYYNTPIKERYEELKKNKKFPSIRINGIFYSQSGRVACIQYTVFNEFGHSSNDNTFFLKKIKGIWWKPLGGLKF